jgi:tRNA C32,U32 (ribose-2'-O)-methylase TrmJ
LRRQGKARADAELTATLEAALVRAGKAEAEAALLREHLRSIKKAVEEVPTPPDDEYRW